MKTHNPLICRPKVYSSTEPFHEFRFNSITTKASSSSSEMQSHAGVLRCFTTQDNTNAQLIDAYFVPNRIVATGIADGVDPQAFLVNKVNEKLYSHNDGGSQALPTSALVRRAFNDTTLTLSRASTRATVTRVPTYTQYEGDYTYIQYQFASTPFGTLYPFSIVIFNRDMTSVSVAAQAGCCLCISRIRHLASDLSATVWSMFLCFGRETTTSSTSLFGKYTYHDYHAASSDLSDRAAILYGGSEIVYVYTSTTLIDNVY